jgi:pyrroline-5-carboxylate reductase
MATLIGIIGCGNMGMALIGGIQGDSALQKKYRLMASDVDPFKRKKVASKYPISVTDDNHSLAEKSDILLLAVKPQEICQVLTEMADKIGKSKLIISIAAGITTEVIEKNLNSKIRVVRVMPNTPALVGEGISAIAGGRFAKRGDIHRTLEIFKAVGEVVQLKEKDLDAVTALSGCGPAYFAYWIGALVEQGIAEGLDPKVALKLAEQTAKGTAVLLRKTQLSLEELIARVASKGGTTEAALKVFDQENLKEKIKRAVHAAAERSRELKDSG